MAPIHRFLIGDICGPLVIGGQSPPAGSLENLLSFGLSDRAMTFC